MYIADQGKYITFLKSEIGHMCQNGGPQAKCGPPRLFMWPTKQIWSLS